MASTEEWKKAYKEIHGKTPTKKDMRTVAPASVKRNIFGTANPPSTPEKASKSSKPVTLSLKRPEGAALLSSSLTRVKKRKLAVPEEELRRSPRKHMKMSDTTKTPSASSPRKPVELRRSPRKAMKIPDSQEVTLEAATSSAKPAEPQELRRSPRKAMKPAVLEGPNVEPATPKKVLELRSPFKVFSPHRLPNAAMSSISPLKRFSARNASRSLFASPEKPIREITLTNVSCLIEQEEKESDEEEEEVVEDMFMDETQVIEEENPGRLELEAKWNSKRTNDGTFKPRAKKDNFVRLNMRKKTFVRGQMSASAKRKKLFRHKRKGF